MKNWKAIVGVIAVFLLGALAGAIVMHRLYQRRLQQFVHGSPAATEFLVRRMNWELNLTPAQRVQVAAIVRDSQRQFRAARFQIAPQLRAAWQDTERRLRDVLTPEQRAKFDKLLAERKARFPLFAPPPPPQP